MIQVHQQKRVYVKVAELTYIAGAGVDANS